MKAPERQKQQASVVARREVRHQRVQPTETDTARTPLVERADMIQLVSDRGARSRDSVLHLQRSLGNQLVTRLLAQRALAQREDDTTRTQISETTDTGNKYTQDLILNKTSARITISLGVDWNKKGTWASDDAYRKFIRSVKTAAYSYMDNKFKVVCTPKAPGAGSATIELPIDFLIYDFPGGYSIDVTGGPPGGDSLMTEAGGKIFEIQSDGTAEEAITYAHEFGHAMLGVSDEYANPAVPGRVLSNDHSIMANYYAQGKAQAQFKARHFQHIATEVAKAFAGYSCGIQSM
jgi:hypothetical protein